MRFRRAAIRPALVRTIAEDEAVFARDRCGVGDDTLIVRRQKTDQRHAQERSIGKNSELTESHGPAWAPSLASLVKVHAHATSRTPRHLPQQAQKEGK